MNKKFRIMLISLLAVMCCSLFILAACSEDKGKDTITAQLSTEKAVVGEEVTLTYSVTGDGSVTVTYSKDGGGSVAFTGTKFTPAEAGTYVFKFTAKNADDVTRTLTVITEQDALFANGKGTASDPYQIETAEQFMNLAKMKSVFVAANQEYYFDLTKDIDLSDVETKTNYYLEVFAGTLNGKNHKIFGANSAAYIFEYAYNNSTFENITVEFGSANITRLVAYSAFKATSENGGNFKTDLASVTLTYNNVDYIGANNAVYFMGDNNSALYYNNNCTLMFAYWENAFVDTWNDTTIVEGTSDSLIFNINLTNCDVKADFSGGGGNSGAAVYLGGQIYEFTKVSLKNCSYEGTFTGKNVGVVFANKNITEEYLSTNVKIENLTVTGKINSLGGNSGITFSNGKAEAEGVTDANKACVNNIAADATLAISASENGEYSITAATNKDVSYYEIQLNLKSIFWYRDNTYSGESYARTDSNNVTIRVEKDKISETGVYKAKAISLHEALEEGIVDDEFVCDKTFESGLSYGYITASDNTVYLVIDYEKAGMYCLFSSVEYVTASIFAFDSSDTPVAYAKGN